MTSVVDRCDERRRDYRTDARHLRQPPAGFVRPAKGHELSVKLVESEIEAAELVEQVAEEFSREIRELGGRDGLLRLREKAPSALGQYDAIFAEKPPHMIDERSSGADNALACTMK